MSDLKDKSIVIIGGTTGLGLSAARACVRAGAKVVIVGRNPQSAEAAGSELADACRTLVGDASESGTAFAAVELAVEQFGRLDGLYHVAGGSGRKFGDGPLHEITDQGFEKTVQLNLTSLFNSNRAAIQKLLVQGGGGSILNMGSVLGYAPSSKFFATHAYAATKAAAVGLTRSCAAYYAPQGVRFNLIAPALVATPMSQRAQEDDSTMKYVASKQPLDGGRIGKPEDLDAAVTFFLSDESKFVTGQILSVDGGWSVSEGQW